MLNNRANLVLQVLADPWNMVQAFNADRPQFVGVTNARQHEKLRRLVCARTKQHFSLGVVRPPISTANGNGTCSASILN